MEYFASLFIGPKVIMLDHTVVICYEMLDGDREGGGGGEGKHGQHID